MLTRINPEIRNKIRVNLNLVQGYIDNKIEVLKAIRLLSNVYHVKTIKLNELQNSDKYVSLKIYSQIVSYHLLMLMAVKQILHIILIL